MQRLFGLELPISVAQVKQGTNFVELLEQHPWLNQVGGWVVTHWLYLGGGRGLCVGGGGEGGMCVWCRVGGGDCVCVLGGGGTVCMCVTVLLHPVKQAGSRHFKPGSNTPLSACGVRCNGLNHILHVDLVFGHKGGMQSVIDAVASTRVALMKEADMDAAHKHRQ